MRSYASSRKILTRFPRLSTGFTYINQVLTSADQKPSVSSKQQQLSASFSAAKAYLGTVTSWADVNARMAEEGSMSCCPTETYGDFLGHRTTVNCQRRFLPTRAARMQLLSSTRQCWKSLGLFKDCIEDRGNVAALEPDFSSGFSALHCCIYSL